VKVIIQKGMALHETVEVTIEVNSMKDWDLVKQAHAKLDERFLVMNKRVIAANAAMNEMTPEMKSLCMRIYEEICGMPQSPPLVKREGHDA